MSVVGCGPADWGNAFVPPLAMRGTRGITYRPSPEGKLDVWQPLCTGDHRPVVVWLYGGYWEKGQRAKYRPLAFPFTSAGCVVVIPDYRLYPGVPFPTFIDDAAAAVGWAHRHAAEFGGDPDRIFLAGHSAGGYVAAMLNLDERYLARQGVPRGVVRGAICLAAPTQFSSNNEDPYVSQAFSKYVSRWSQTQPTTFVDGDEPPMLLIQGDADQLVTPGSNRYLASVIRAKGGRAVAVSYPEMSHYELLFSMAWPLWGTADVRDWCLRFMRENGAWGDAGRDATHGRSTRIEGH
jgi:acetyl esterase/lipase